MCWYYYGMLGGGQPTKGHDEKDYLKPHLACNNSTRALDQTRAGPATPGMRRNRNPHDSGLFPSPFWRERRILIRTLDLKNNLSLTEAERYPQPRLWTVHGGLHTIGAGEIVSILPEALHRHCIQRCFVFTKSRLSSPPVNLYRCSPVQLTCGSGGENALASKDLYMYSFLPVCRS